MNVVRKSGLDAIGAGTLTRGGAGGLRLDHPTPWEPGTPLGQHLRIERLARVVEGRHVYLANNVDPLWRHRKCWHCGNKFNPGSAPTCSYCGTPLIEERFLATVRHDARPHPGWEEMLRLRLDHPTVVSPVAAFYREGRPVTVFAYHGERMLADQPAPLPSAVLIPLLYRLGTSLRVYHEAGVHLLPFTAANVLVMPDGSGRWSDLEALRVTHGEALSRDPERPILEDVRRLCRILRPFADPDDAAVLSFLQQGIDGHFGPPRRLCEIVEQRSDALAKDALEPTHAAITDVGLARARNEDAMGWVRINEQSALYVVADGMGGHARGPEASRIAVDVVLDRVAESVRAGRTAPEVLAGLLRGALNAANGAVTQRSRELGATSMGATIVALLIVGDHACVAHAGDARAYLGRGREVRRVTTDHSVVQAMIERGTLSEADARHHPKANIVLSYIGQEGEIEIDAEVLPVKAGDRWLLCSDGLWGEIGSEGIAEHLVAWPEPRRCAQRLVRAAFEAGGRDNVTAMVVDVFPRDAAAPVPTIAG